MLVCLRKKQKQNKQQQLKKKKNRYWASSFQIKGRLAIVIIKIQNQKVGLHWKPAMEASSSPRSQALRPVEISQSLVYQWSLSQDTNRKP